MTRLPRLTQPQKDLIVAVFTTGFAGAAGVIAAVWVIAALVLGSWEIVRLIGGG